MLNPYPSNVLVCQQYKKDSYAQMGFMAVTRMRRMTAEVLQHNLNMQAPDNRTLISLKPEAF